jgi:hypothetical protein
VGASSAVQALAPPCYAPARNAQTGINIVAEGEQGNSATNVIKDIIVETFLEDQDMRLCTVGHPHHSCTLPVFIRVFNRKQF